MGILRLLLALSVVLWHAPGQIFVLFHGGIAVELFFIISGFYMALVINEKYSRKGAENWRKTFYANRIMRLAPAYILVVFVEALWYFKTDTPSIFGPNDLSISARLALVFMNLFILGQDMWQTILTHASTGIPNRFITGSVTLFWHSAFEPFYMFIGQAWSLGIELIFYLVAPFIVLSRRRVLALFVSCLLVRFYFVTHADVFPNAPWRSRFFVSNMIFFFMGIVSYWIYQKIRVFQCAKWFGIGFSVSGLAFIFVNLLYSKGIFLFAGLEDYDQPRLWYFYLFFTIGLPFLFLISKDVKWDSYIGEISYPVYLVHGFLIGFLPSRLPQILDPKTRLALIVFAIIIVSTGIYLLIDKPVDRFRRNFMLVSSSESRVSGNLKFSVITATFVLFAIALLQPFQKCIAPPVLVEVVENYNLVKYGALYYGVPHRVSVNWRKDNLKTIPGIIIDHSADIVRNLIRIKGRYNFEQKAPIAPAGLSLSSLSFTPTTGFIHLLWLKTCPNFLAVMAPLGIEPPCFKVMETALA